MVPIPVRANRLMSVRLWSKYYLTALNGCMGKATNTVKLFEKWGTLMKPMRFAAK